MMNIIYCTIRSLRNKKKINKYHPNKFPPIDKIVRQTLNFLTRPQIYTFWPQNIFFCPKITYSKWMLPINKATFHLRADIDFSAHFQPGNFRVFPREGRHSELLITSFLVGHRERKKQPLKKRSMHRACGAGIIPYTGVDKSEKSYFSCTCRSKCLMWIECVVIFHVNIFFCEFAMLNFIWYSLEELFDVCFEKLVSKKI